MTSDPGSQDTANSISGPQETIDDRAADPFQLFPNGRVRWPGAPNEWSRLTAARRAQSLPILDLTVSNPSRAALGDAELALHLAFAQAPSFDYNPHAQGTPAAREAIAAWYANRPGNAPCTVLSPERLLLTASSSESYSFLFQTLCAPGDEILAPLPSYPLFEYLAGLNAVKLRTYRLRYHAEWSIDFQSIEHALTPRTKALVVVNPNNPTGSYISESEARHLLEFCAAHRLALIADEVFEEYALTPPHPRRASFSQPQEQALSVSLGGLSKSAGLPQMKLGWIIFNGPENAVENLRTRLLLVADTYLSVSTPVQAALPSLLDAGRTIGGLIRERVQANLHCLRTLAGSAPHLTLLPVEGGWNAVVRLPGFLTDAEWCGGLIEREGVLVQPGYLYDFEQDAMLVLSLLTPPEVFSEGVKRLCAYVEAIVRSTAP
ncbi:MAG: pyridoxal phosphate-dependent aminotransferase [Bryobacterales bacterium]|nr:pyridoxal phosphate-dependent aminotransferase [Bryobacterales bacterium]